MKKFFALLALCALAAPASAAVICAGCEYDEGAAGSFLGVFNGVTRDLATFTHTGVNLAPAFEDFWVFDISPEGTIASISADFTILAPLFDFAGELYRDAGSVCPAFACTSIERGALIGSADAGDGQRWQMLDFLGAGRYVLRIFGEPNSTNGGAYSGQLALFGFTVKEPGTVGLLGLGLLALAWVARRRRT